jgi:F-type H+-transporting ATPase subunit b
MIFNVWTFVFEVVNFVVLVEVLRRLLFRPLQEAIDRRKQANAKAQADADKAHQEATLLQQQLSIKLAAFDQDRQELIRTVREQTEADRKTALSDAERAVQKRREEAAQQFEKERAEALQSLHGELVQSALALAERFLHEASTSTLQQQLGGRLAEELQHIGDDERERLRGELEGDDTAIVETATELNGDILERLDTAVKSLAGRTVRLSVQTRPELLGGLRLRLGGHVWDATLTGALRETTLTSPGKAPP